MIRADLHIHSQYSSDGEFRPADIVGKCAAGGVDLFALTDHNTVRGLDEACDGALKAGLESVPGIEIDCSFEGTDLHLLGYGIDWKSPDFRALEETVAAKVMASFGETVGKLRRLGFAVDEQAVLAAAAGLLFWWYASMVRREFGGITGDLLGFFVELSQGGLLLVLALCSLFLRAL